MKLKELVALVCADVEIYLLCDESQENFKEQDTFTREEILDQLKSTMINTCNALEKAGLDIDKDSI